MENVDLLVIGASMAGLTAGARAVRNGLSVMVVEIAADAGGSARVAGYAWTAPSHDVMDQHNPWGDTVLKRALVDRFPEGVEWIRSLDVDIKDAQRVLGFGRGHQFDTHQYVDTCRRIIREGGGTLLVGDVCRTAGGRGRGRDGGGAEAGRWHAHARVCRLHAHRDRRLTKTPRRGWRRCPADNWTAFPSTNRRTT
nr:FAD-dependent oxidoreductase [Streptomyces violaceusniger]